MIELSPNVSYLPASENPLSADVVLIKEGGHVWIYDVGNGKKASETINRVQGEKYVVLSHFHADHAGNIAEVKFDRLYGGKETIRHIRVGDIVDRERLFEGGKYASCPFLPLTQRAVLRWCTGNMPFSATDFTAKSERDITCRFYLKR